MLVQEDREPTPRPEQSPQEAFLRHMNMVDDGEFIVEHHATRLYGTAGRLHERMRQAHCEPVRIEVGKGSSDVFLVSEFNVDGMPGFWHRVSLSDPTDGHLSDDQIDYIYYEPGRIANFYQAWRFKLTRPEGTEEVNVRERSFTPPITTIEPKPGFLTDPED